MRLTRSGHVITAAAGCAALLLSAVATAAAAEVVPTQADAVTPQGTSPVLLPLNGQPVTVPTAPGQEALFAFDARTGERLWIGCRLDSYESPGSSPPALALLVHDRGEQTPSACRHPDNPDYPTLFNGHRIPPHRPDALHALFVDAVKPQPNSVTIWAYRIPAGPEVNAAVDGSPTSVRATVPGQEPVVRFPGIKNQRYVVTCDTTASTRRSFVDLVAPPGVPTGSGQSTECGPAGRLTTAPLPESGNFGLKGRFLGDGTGTFTVTVTPAPSPG